ncbi:hypothetical protein IWQ56_003712 [Coemansia nantahalensis]|uniref:Uncharacterized protein n=1 Tax=Coemansia nantahalensis TaxID=2789366 RepID=A0ACC1K7P1_9FUNG|nr:hypothetical protein IWQ56_003712 [Coemansia nantahalensis]KAJ2774995.1 hypothetical protein IWQ57_000581 [Coemansia nantahalensis]
MKTAIIAAALVAAASALPTDGAGSSVVIGNIDPDSLAGAQCKAANGKTLQYVAGGDFAALSDDYMSDSLAAQNCGRCIKATTKPTDGSAPKSLVLTVVDACEGCAGTSFFANPSSVSKLAYPGMTYVDDVSWSFVPCPGA